MDGITGAANTDDTISGGAGVDTLVYTGGTDSLTGGAGNDVFDINAVGADVGSIIIADVADGDTIDLAGISTGTIADVTATNWDAADITGTLGASATLANYLDAAADGDGRLMPFLSGSSLAATHTLWPLMMMVLQVLLQLLTQQYKLRAHMTSQTHL